MESCHSFGELNGRRIIFSAKLAVTNMNKKNKLMKSTITLLAIIVLAAFALIGCNQNTPSNSTDTQSANSSMSHASDTTGGVTNMPVTNSMLDVNTNMPTPIILPDTNTNMPAVTNQ
jgi:hypothetical protein